MTPTHPQPDPTVTLPREVADRVLAALEASNLKEDQIVAGQAGHLVLRFPMAIISQMAAAKNELAVHLSAPTVAEPVPMRGGGDKGHQCGNVTWHRGDSYVCQYAGHAVGKDSCCEKCPSAAAPPTPQEAPGQVPAEPACVFCGGSVERGRCTECIPVSNGPQPYARDVGSLQPTPQEAPEGLTDSDVYWLEAGAFASTNDAVGLPLLKHWFRKGVRAAEAVILAKVKPS